MINPVEGKLRVDGRRAEEANAQTTTGPEPASPTVVPSRHESGQVQIERGNPGPKGESSPGAGSTADPKSTTSPTSGAESETSSCENEDNESSCQDEKDEKEASPAED
jgi:hypothetical protein